MSRFLGVEHTRVHRALGTLELMGLAERTADRKYQPGPAIHVFAAQSLRGSRLLSVALPYLRALKKDGTSVALGVLWNEHVCYLVHARPEDSIDEGIGRHDLWPALGSSLGVALLAFRACATGPSGSGGCSEIPEASVPIREVEAFMEKVRASGVARLRYEDGTVSIGVPVGSPPIAGIALSRKGMDEETIRVAADDLRRTAAEIADALRDGSSVD